MRLIACPDCGREVSARAISCPGCGLAEPGQRLLEEVAEAQAMAAARVTRRANLEWLLLAVPSFAGVMWAVPRVPAGMQTVVLVVYVLLLPIVYIWRRHRVRKREESGEPR